MVIILVISWSGNTGGFQAEVAGENSNSLDGCTDVHLYPPNDWGLFDMAGNAREWCYDYYIPNCPFSANKNNEQLDVSIHTVKGCSWDKAERYCQCEHSEGKWGRIGTVGIGFRIVKVVNGK